MFFRSFMTKSAHYGTAFSAPVDIILMAPDALFMKRRQQGDWNFFCQLFFVTSRTLTPLAFIPVGKNIKIMMADPASNGGFVQIMVKPHRTLMMSAEFPAFEIHDSFIGFFILGPSH
jgi:hypothetical protein